MQSHSFVLPEQLPSPTQVGSGIAVFHKNYDINDPNNHSTHRRYFLSRCWDSSLPTMTFFGMNPSTASSCSNDPTVEFMMQVAKHNECGSLYVVNTSPFIKSSDTRKRDFVIDNETREYIQFAVAQSKFVVLAWGENGQKSGISTISRHFTLRRLLAANSDKIRIFEFGGLNTRSKFPKHPLQRKDRFEANHRLLALNINDFNSLIPNP